MNESFPIIGKSLIRPESSAKVTGEALYAADIQLPGMLYVKILRSSRAHAIIKHIDTSPASVLEGVKAVITGEGCRGRLMGYCIEDQPPVAFDKVRFYGEPVAAVVADSPETAAEACLKIKIDYEDLPHVFDVREAMKPGAPLVHEQIEKYRIVPAYNPQYGTNIYHSHTTERGSPEHGFEQADRVFQNEFTFPHISHCQLEPHCCLSWWKSDGSLHVWSSTQSPFMVRSILAKLFDLPISMVNVTSPFVGGGFGGKADYTIEPLTAYIASFVKGKPVKLVLDREEMFSGTLMGRGSHAIIKTGVKKDGTITAWHADIVINAGAYGNYCINIIMGAARSSCGVYNIPNIRIDARSVYTNLPINGAYRAYGHPEGHWGAERQIDIIAREMGFDPVQFRLQNCLKPGDNYITGLHIEEENGNLSECIRRTAECMNFEQQNSKGVKKFNSRHAKGKGIAAFVKTPAMAVNKPSSARISFNEDCSVSLQVGAVDMGQGSAAALTQIASETLRIPPEKIRFTFTVNTELHPTDWQTVASRTTWMCGNAVMKACLKAISDIKKLASRIWKLDTPDLIEYDGRMVFVKDKDLALPLESIIMGYALPDGSVIGGPVNATANFYPEKAEMTFGCQGAEVTVDLKYGTVSVDKLVAAVDVGRVINPMAARGQIIGAMIQGIGPVLWEKIRFSHEGRILNDNFHLYKVPNLKSAKDIQTEVIFLETPQKDGPYGARALAEHGIVSVAPAIANAIFDAVGININHLPASSEDLTSG
jgi:carbon-monoxide dehydrogenase large subunit